MAKYNGLKALFSAIADAIRAKTGGADTIKAEDFPTAIEGISGGGDSEGVFTIKGYDRKFYFIPGTTWDDWISSGMTNFDYFLIDFYGNVGITSTINSFEDPETGSFYDVADTLKSPDGQVLTYDAIQSIEYDVLSWQ